MADLTKLRAGYALPTSASSTVAITGTPTVGSKLTAVVK